MLFTVVHRIASGVEKEVWATCPIRSLGLKGQDCDPRHIVWSIHTVYEEPWVLEISCTWFVLALVFVSWEISVLGEFRPTGVPDDARTNSSRGA